jgi:hypothetical protein
MSAADALLAELRSVIVDGESLVPEASAHRALIVRGGDS